MERTSAVTIASLAIFIAAFIQPGSALKCYECNSHNDSRCAQEVPPAQLEKDCSTHQNEAKKYVLCRKIVQTIEYEVNGQLPDSRVIRSCGWDDTAYNNTCYKRSGYGGDQRVCSCYTDLCNSSENLHAKIALFALLVLTIKFIPDTRVIRSCGWDDTTYKNSCYQRSGFGGRQEVCACTTDLCNSSPSLYVTSTTIIAALALTIKSLY